MSDEPGGGGEPPPPLPASSGRPVERYDAALLDLDGVVYVGGRPVPGVADALAAARAGGMRLAFVTNNASRDPDEVAALLKDLGVEATPTEVVTSAQAAARMLAQRLQPGTRVLVVGSDALRREVRGRRLRAVATAEDEPEAVVQGYAPDVGWRELAEATVAVRRGALWVATNTDTTLPSPRGPLPGNGTLVSAVRAASGRAPLVAGKPEPALLEEARARTSAARPLVVGDRLDTDIEGASRIDADSMLVLSGVTTARELLNAGPGRRPTYVAADAAGVLADHPVPSQVGTAEWRCRGWLATVNSEGALVLTGAGNDDLDALRALCAARWAVGCTGPLCALGDRAQVAARRLGLRETGAGGSSGAQPREP